MKLATPISTASDLSSCAFEDAWVLCGRPESCSLIVGVKEVGTARIVAREHKPIPPYIWVNPEWEHEWMVSSKHAAAFSESAG